MNRKHVFMKSPNKKGGNATFAKRPVKLSMRQKVLRIALIVAAILIVAFVAPVIALVLKERIRWGQHKDEELAKFDEYYQALAKGQGLFDPTNPSGSRHPTRIYDRNGIVVGEFLPPEYEIVTPDNVNPVLEQMILLMEDQHFYKHSGVNWGRILILAYKNIINMRVLGGGSTITQQLAKLHFTQSEKNLERKIYELFATLAIERQYSKEDILIMYLNTVYLGATCYGFEAASRYYFNKPLRDCVPVEYAMLVGMLPNPARYSPVTHPKTSRKRVVKIFNRLLEHNYIDKETAERQLAYYDEHYGEKLKVYVRGAQWKMIKNETPYFNEHIRQILSMSYSNKSDIVSSGMSIYTTIDYNHYKHGQRALKEMLETLEAAASSNETVNTVVTNGVTNVITNRPSIDYEGAIVAIDPRTGGVVNMIGGSGYTLRSQYNRAVRARRQIGSLIKPFIYACAFEKGMTPSTIIEDKPYRYGSYAPKNYGGGYRGEVVLYDALRKSINTVAVQLLYQEGLSSFRKVLGSVLAYGNPSIPRNLTLGLGTIELTPLEVASAFTVFPNYGKVVTPHYINKVIDANGQEITLKYQKQSVAKDVRGISPVSAYYVNTTLQGVLQSGGTGAGSAARTGFRYPISGKSGTTSDLRDAWFAVYYSDLVAIAWLGSDERYTLPRGSTGGRVGATVLFNYLKPLLRDGNANEFTWQIPETTDGTYIEGYTEEGVYGIHTAPSADVGISVETAPGLDKDPFIEEGIVELPEELEENVAGADTPSPEERAAPSPSEPARTGKETPPSDAVDAPMERETPPADAVDAPMERETPPSDAVDAPPAPDERIEDDSAAPAEEDARIEEPALEDLLENPEALLDDDTALDEGTNTPPRTPEREDADTTQYEFYEEP